jgi:hypothetical protein
VTVTHEATARRFTHTEDGHVAELVYRVHGDRIVLIHTGVPEALEGKGVGGELVRAALDHAAGAGLTVVPRCPFARRWLESHPDEAGRVPVEWP